MRTASSSAISGIKQALHAPLAHDGRAIVAVDAAVVVVVAMVVAVVIVRLGQGAHGGASPPRLGGALGHMGRLGAALEFGPRESAARPLRRQVEGFRAKQYAMRQRHSDAKQDAPTNTDAWLGP